MLKVVMAQQFMLWWASMVELCELGAYGLQ